MGAEGSNSFLRGAGLINGEWVRRSALFPVLNPATGQKIVDVACLGPQDAQDALSAAQGAFSQWCITSEQVRTRVLTEWAAIIRKHLTELSQLTTLEQGRPLRESEKEWLGGADMLEWCAAEIGRVQGSVFPFADGGPMKMVLQQPVGVVAAITPWNFPVLSVLVKCASAIAAGCSIVLKPSEETPLSALAIGALSQMAGLPHGVLNIIPTQYPAPVGEVLAQDPRVKVLTFTGSAQVGKHLSAKAAGTVKRVELELGGNAPFIVFDDANLDLAANDLIGAKFFNNGQICVGANRIYLHDQIYDAFLDKFVAKVQALQVGNGLEPQSVCGPLINKSACEKITHLIDDALDKGASVLIGGHALAGVGSFFSPTVLVGVTTDMRIRHEEIFGPVAAIYKFSDVEKIIDEANGSPAGLAAYYYTQDPYRQHSLVRRINAGMVGCNTTNIFDQRMGFGGSDQSGHGREGGIGALTPFLEEKNFFLKA